MSLHADKQKLANGKESIRIRYWKDNQHKTLPPDQHPIFKTMEEARAFCKKQNAKADADRHLEKHAKGMDEIAWKRKYANFVKEVQLYIDWYKDEAPNSWETNRSWLENYIIPYFLGKGLNNPNLWYTEFETFRTWLEKESLTMNGKKLSYSSMGHVIKCLNSYLKYLGLHNKMDILISQVKCRGFDRSLSNKRGANDLIKTNEYETLKRKLDTSREFLTILMHTGMRVMELYSLQVSNLMPGEDGLDSALIKPFKQLGLTIYGYIRLESQIKTRSKYRNPKDGTIARKPLKSKPKISPEYNRVIPITDAETWEALVRNRRRAFKEFEGRIHTTDNPDDYLIMNVDINELRRDMRKHTKKTFHCCRHTFTTNLVRSFRGVNYGPELIKGITGHTSAEFQRYVHLSWEDDNQVKKKKISNF